LQASASTKLFEVDERESNEVENEHTHVLKSQGYHREHNYGHGRPFLSTTLLRLNCLAFLAHTFLELVDTPYRAIRQKLSARKTFFHDFTTLTKYLCL
jgi:hypothetical protein